MRLFRERARREYNNHNSTEIPLRGGELYVCCSVPATMGYVGYDTVSRERERGSAGIGFCRAALFERR